MAKYKADVWLGVNSGIQTVEVHSSSLSGVTDQICSVYHVDPKDIRNVRTVSENEEFYTEGPEISSTAFGFGIAILLFAIFPAYFLMIVLGGTGTWVALKVNKTTITKAVNSKNDRVFAFIVAAALFSGSFGYVVGNKIDKDYINPTNTQQVK
jgi:hypothetical protein